MRVKKFASIIFLFIDTISIMVARPFSPEEFKSMYSKVPRLCVEVVIKDERGVLLTLRKLPSWNNMWHLPGGTVYYKETLEEAVRRIAKEELNIVVKVDRLLGYIEYPSEEKERGFGWSVGIAFLCRVKSGTLKGGAQAQEIKYFKEIPHNTIPEAREFLEKNL